MGLIKLIGNVGKLAIPGGLIYKSLENSRKYKEEISERGIGVVDKLVFGVSGIADIWVANKVFEGVGKYLVDGSIDLDPLAIVSGVRLAAYASNVLFEMVVKDDQRLSSFADYKGY